MAVNSVKIFDDTVLKLSVNQGLEDQRATETLGSFTMGELAFTRDTGRLFVGDNSDEEHFGLQETVGGILTGNKYLGLIDSKPLVIFTDNGTPLKYEVPTSPTNTQELASFTENALLLKDSKFRMKSPEGASEEWQRWDRLATYNAKYNAYNGDYMFDIYNNALILFDNRITTDPNSEFQPQIKMEEGTVEAEDGEMLNTSSVRATPETFIVNGEEIPSDDPRAINLTRRTVIQNFNKENEDYTNIHPVYGDGYVVMRIVEPDNQSLRFRPRSYDEAGNPTAGDGNFSHNIMEILSVSAQHMAGAMSDDFIIADTVYLNRDLKLINSITGSNGTLKLPMNITFSNPANGGRGAIGTMRWDFQPLVAISDDPDATYKVQLTARDIVNDEDNPETSYQRFNVNVVQDIPYIPSYRIALEGGLMSNQQDSTKLTLDITATDENDLNIPVLKIDPTAETEMYNGEITTPFETEGSDDYVYIDNLVVARSGRVVNADVYGDSYYEQAKDKIDRYEEQNTTINYLKEPITIISSSYDQDLLSEVSEDNLTVNARLDFLLSPYLYCRRKVVSSPNTALLPSIDSTIDIPDPTSTYFTEFSDTNVKAWNNLITVMGQNHYDNLASTKSEIPILDDSVNSPLKKSVFKTMSNYLTDADNNMRKYEKLELNDLSIIENAVFYWYKEVITFEEDDENNPGQTITVQETKYYAVDGFDSRTTAEKQQQGKFLEYVRVEGNNANLIDGGDGVIQSEPDTKADGSVITHFAIFPDSPLLNRLQSYISYGNNTDQWTVKYNLSTSVGLSFDYGVLVNSAAINGIESIIFKGTTTVTVDGLQLIAWLTTNNNRITVDTVLPNSSVTPANFDLMIIQFVPDVDEEEWDDEENGMTYEEYKLQERGVYQLIKNINYLTGATPPSTLSPAKVYNGTSVVDGIVDETIDLENQIYIPTHARNIILEVTHITDTNNRIGIFYANEFEDLGVSVSGVATNQSFVPSFSQASYVASDGVYKLTVPKPQYPFHNDANLIPDESTYVYSPNTKEKALCITSASETRIIEVPLQKSNYMGQRHFSLRLANIAPSTNNGINYLAIRVVGYSV